MCAQEQGSGPQRIQRLRRQHLAHRLVRHLLESVVILRVEILPGQLGLDSALELPAGRRGDPVLGRAGAGCWPGR